MCRLNSDHQIRDTPNAAVAQLTYYASRNNVRLMVRGGNLSSEGLLILASLADAPKHGYAIQLDIASHERTTPRPRQLVWSDREA